MTITLIPILILPVCLSTNNSLSLFVPSHNLAEQKIDPPANLTSSEIKVLVMSHTFPIIFTSLIGDIGSFLRSMMETTKASLISGSNVKKIVQKNKNIIK